MTIADQPSSFDNYYLAIRATLDISSEATFLATFFPFISPARSCLPHDTAVRLPPLCNRADRH